MNSLVKGINHVTFSVSNLDVSLAFYQQVFDAALLLRTERMAYLDLSGLWIALNVQADIPRQEIRQSYTHLAFTVEAQDMEHMEDRLRQLHVPIKPGRPRSAGEAHSLYFTDPDGHLLEVHSGDRETRLAAYKEAVTLFED
jgi:metallothiol transferase